ncbi:Tumor necrosis factor receptor superfamily member 19 [Oryzias melastigma]|uniref:Tumor necrosis factor receptor superfamily member 19 n=1 Tax=Oryzias melastigma TaxID=30732 RepID=A0A834EYX2_ORYME|nr:Tumor necrosis factor receptor superfamily member 19 [Oryzias melastigma]
MAVLLLVNIRVISAEADVLGLRGSGRVNLVPLPPVVTSPRDMALAAVICVALATVLLALLVLCVIYCKRQLLEKKPSAVSLRSQDCPYSGAELSCLDARWLHDFPQRPCCQCHLGPGHSCGPVHLIPSLCCDERCSLDHNQDISPFQSQMSLNDGNPHLNEEGALLQLQGHSEHACWEAAGMRKSLDSLEYSGLSRNDPERVDGAEEEEEEEGRARGKSLFRGMQQQGCTSAPTADTKPRRDELDFPSMNLLDSTTALD